VRPAAMSRTDAIEKYIAEQVPSPGRPGLQGHRFDCLIAGEDFRRLSVANRKPTAFRRWWVQLAAPTLVVADTRRCSRSRAPRTGAPDAGCAGRGGPNASVRRHCS